MEKLRALLKDVWMAADLEDLRQRLLPDME
jgi:hypothetical protein